MNIPSNLHLIDKIPQNDAFTHNYRDFARCHETIKLICRLTRLLQQHRGATMGWLSGQSAFEVRIARYQQSVNQIFILLKEISEARQDYLSPGELRDLLGDWLFYEKCVAGKTSCQK